MIKTEKLVGVKLLNPDLFDSNKNSYEVTVDTYKSPNLVGEIIEANDDFVRVKFRDYEQNFKKWYILKYLKIEL